MNNQANRTHSFNLGHRATRLMSAVMGCVVGMGVLAAVVSGMAQRSDGRALGDFVASRLAAEQPVVAAASRGRSAT